MSEQKLKARVLIDDKCVSERDLLLRNFLRKNIISGLTGRTVEMFDINNVSRNVASSNYVHTGKIAVGDGTTSPTRTDYKLEHQIAESSDLVVNELEDKVIISTTFTFSSDTTISEVGFFVLTQAIAYPFLLTRDTFTPELFPANTPRTVSIEISI